MTKRRRSTIDTVRLGSKVAWGAWAVVLGSAIRLTSLSRYSATVRTLPPEYQAHPQALHICVQCVPRKTTQTHFTLLPSLHCFSSSTV